MAKILVIGGAGYIGSHVVKALLEAKHKVVVFDNLSTGMSINLFENAEFIQGDILNFEQISTALSNNIDAVVHLAAKKAVGESMEQPHIYSQNNISGSLNIFDAMVKNNVKHIVFSSSAAVYGMPEYTPIDEDHSTNPINYYGFTKLEIERFMSWYSKIKNFSYVSLRYFNAVGYDADGKIRGKEKNPQNLLPIIMEVISKKREKLMVFGKDYDTFDGTCVRDYIHVTDLASAHVLAVEYLLQNNPSEIINLGTGIGTSINQIIEATQKLIGKKLPVEYTTRRAGDPALLTASNKKAKTVLAWEPQYTDIEEIIKTTYALEQK